MKTLSPTIQKLIERYQGRYRSFGPASNSIRVEKVKPKITSFEEKEQRERIFIRKKVILKNLKKKLVAQKENEIASFLIKDLIRKGYVPNDYLARSKIKETQNIIDKYVFVLGHASEEENNRNKKQLQEWILNIAAHEIEDNLAIQNEKINIEFISQLLKKRIKTPDLNPEEKEDQIFIASQKITSGFNHHLSSYYLLLEKYPFWKNPSREQLIDMAVDIYSIWEDVRREIDHPLRDILYEECKKHVPFLLPLKEILRDNLESIDKLEEPKWLESKINRLYQDKIKETKKELFHVAVISASVIFLFKTFLLLIVEIPLTEFPLGLPTILINVLALPLLLIILMMRISLPGSEDINLATIEITKLVYSQKEEVKILERSPLKRKITSLFYLLTFLTFTGIIMFFLYQLRFPLISQLIFLIFFFITCFIENQSRKRVERIKTFKSEDIHAVTEAFSYPLTKLKRWISYFSTISRYAKTYF